MLFAEELKDTRFAKLSPVDDVAGLAGDWERLEAAEIGVERPDGPFDRTLGKLKPEPIGGGLLVGAFELGVQLNPFKSSMAG